MVYALDLELEAQIEAAYAEYADCDEQNVPTLAEPTVIKIDYGWEIELDMLMIGMLGKGRRRSNPKENSMRRMGKRYTVRKDHGTTAYMREIANASSQQGSCVPGSVRDLRKQRKREERCDAATLAKLSRIG